METNEIFTTVPLPCSNMSVETVEPVGTDEQDTSSSSSTDDIPQKVRDLFSGRQPEDFVRVVGVDEDGVILARAQWVFVGRNRIYRDSVIAENTGTCTEAVIMYEGRSMKRTNDTPLSCKKNQQVHINLNGAFIP